MTNLKQGAMFGLDARIALAIFGALSVISGAALYSAIEKAKMTQVLSEMEEFGKAWSAYYLDTGENLKPYDPSNPADHDYYIRRAIDLKNDPGVSGWKGPYLSLDDFSTYSLQDSTKRWFIIMADSDAWSTTGFQNHMCTTGVKCAVYTYFAYATEDKRTLAKALDEYIDGGDGDKAGKFRYDYNSSGPSTRLHLKVSPIKNPND